ncbi:MAG: ribonuclease R [Planctomycetaceae bacterium]|nr:ribonuclease R [Planctomycetaceae bacterium]
MDKDSNPLPELAKRLLELVNVPNYTPVKPKALARFLQIGPDNRSAFRRALKKLATAGLIVYGANRLVYPLKDGGRQQTVNGKNLVLGTFRRSASGIGFVRPRNWDDADSEPQDIFIPAHFTLDAMTGDLVAVELFEKKKPRKKQKHSHFSDSEDRGPRGKIVQILERTKQRFVGTYCEENGWGYVQVDGNQFYQPILIVDPSVQTAKPGDKVVIEMLCFPTHYRDGEAVIVEVLGPHGVPGLDTLLILREYGLPEHFSEAALRAARDQAVKFFDALPEEPDEPNDEYYERVHAYLESIGRVDLTHQVAITIDPPDARDFDDAVSLEKMDNGHWLLVVHIADVAHFVPEGSPIDLEAQDRATSVYLPDHVIPMLPEVISNSLASLQPNKIRFANSVFMEFTPEGVRCNTIVRKSAIRSTARLTYEEVQDFLDSRQQTADGREEENSANCQLPSAVCRLLSDSFELSRLLRARRKRRGALELNMPDIKIDLDDDGKVVGAHAEIQREANGMIEEFMLSANEAIAEHLEARDIPFLRRVHSNPSYRKIKEFTDFLRMMKLDDLEPEELLESRFTIQKILDKAKGTPAESAVQFSLLRAMQRAVYSPEEEGHYALASDCYTHFTSPIRRYPDLTIHRLLWSEEGKQRADSSLHFLGIHCSERERRAEDAERELVKLKLIDFMSRNIGMQLDAVITGMNPSGIFAQGIEIPAEGLIPIETLPDDHYRFDRQARSIIGRRKNRGFRLGDRLRVEVVAADFNARVIDFRLVVR